MTNSIEGIIHKPTPIVLGRWRQDKTNDLKVFYTNMDHCGDMICGSPQELKKSYPNYFKNTPSS